MSDIHRTAFEFFQKEIDGVRPGRERAAEIERHLASCPVCRMDLRLDQGLRAEASLKWPETMQPRHPARPLLDAIQAQGERGKQLQLAFRPLRVAAWAALLLLFVLAINWVIANLRLTPAVTPSPTEEEQAAPPPTVETPTPQADAGELQKVPLQPIARGSEMAEPGIWSPEGPYLFFSYVPLPEDPLYDRGFTMMSFLNAGTGEICRHPHQLTGPVAIGEHARWTPDGLLLTVLDEHGVQLVPPCSEEIQDLNDLFLEPVSRLPAWEESGPLFLLQGDANYWLFDASTLTARILEVPAPSSGGEDRQVWSPSGERLAIIQPDPGAYGERSILFVLEGKSGAVLHTVEIPYGEEFTTPILEWLREDAIFVWAFGDSGPLLVDLGPEEPQITAVLPGLFGLDIRYPDDINAAMVAADEVSGNYHIAIKLNTASDKSTVLYHSETGQVERFERDAHTMLLFPDGDFETLPRPEDEPSQSDEFELVWVDDPDRAPELLAVVRHTPRSYPTLRPRILPDRSRIVIASSQGVSLVSIPGGEMTGFWSLESDGDPFFPTISVSPGGDAIAISSQIQYEDGTPWSSALYLLRLEP